jgi:hypothetical protein
MKILRAIAILALAVAACFVPAASGSDEGKLAACVEGAMKWITPGQPVTLFCRDGSRSPGRIVEFDSTRGTLLFQPVGKRASRRDLPSADIMRLEWRESGKGKPSVGAAIGGLAIGALLGYMIGTAGPEHTNSGTLGSFRFDFDFTPAYASIGGAAVGMIVGLVVSQACSHRDYAVDDRGERANLSLRPGESESALPRARRHLL